MFERVYFSSCEFLDYVIFSISRSMNYKNVLIHIVDNYCGWITGDATCGAYVDYAGNNPDIAGQACV